MKPPRNVLICRTDRIGDVVLTLPVARAIKEAYPECRVGFLVREYTLPLVLGHPFIDEVHATREKAGRLRVGEMAQRLRARKYDTAIAVYPTPRVALTLLRAGIPMRVGTRYRWFSPLFNHPVKVRRRVSPLHELEHNLRLLEPLGVQASVDRASVQFDLHPDPEALVRVTTRLAELGIAPGVPRVVVHPGSGGSAVDLPVGKLISVVQGIQQVHSLPVLLTGTTAEQSLTGQVASATGAVDLAGGFDLRELIAVLSTASLVLANSTGPIHLAAALGRPVLGFYSRARSCGPERWGPYAANAQVFTPGLDCSGCTLDLCRQRQCMETVDLESVLAAATAVLARGS